MGELCSASRQLTGGPLLVQNPRATSAFVVDHSAGHVRIHFDKNTVPGGLVDHNNVCQVDAKVRSLAATHTTCSAMYSPTCDRR